MARVRRLAALVAPLAAGPAGAEVLWRGDFGTGTTAQWSGLRNDLAVVVVDAPVREGRYALRIDGSNAARTDRIELQHQPRHPAPPRAPSATSAGA
jgi:hypothetical protein